MDTWNTPLRDLLGDSLVKGEESYTVHLGLMYVGRNEPHIGYLPAGFVMAGDSMAVWGEDDDEDHPGPRHVTINHECFISPLHVAAYRVELDQVLDHDEWRLLDYAFVTDQADWSKNCRTWVLTEPRFV